ncbi:MAG: uroporphyrinogen-III C-methyltransferase [Geminicoccaceae bacterium]|nr:uroporphyrinogen-III C-methyltransferase [Geminicoccaceae bacterium]
MQPPTVYLVGAGPGDPELLTLKAARLLQLADVVVHDRLVSEGVLALVQPRARRIDVGKAPGRHPLAQVEINELLVRLAAPDRVVVRLKGGDPFVFGRGGEEALFLLRRGIRVEVVPGITAASGCAATALIPLTHRGFASGVRFVAGHCREDAPLELDWRGLADPDTTLVVYMGLARIEEIARRLIAHGLPPATPAAAIAEGTTARERVERGTLATIAERVRAARLSSPVLFVIGRVVEVLAPLAEAARAELKLGRLEVAGHA